MFDDPEIVKLLIYGLGGACAVLFLAVLILAFKRNIYYVDENGVEIDKATRKQIRKEEKASTKVAKKEEVAPVEAVVEEVEEEAPAVSDNIEKTAVYKAITDVEEVEEEIEEVKEEPVINQTLQVPVMKNVVPKIKGALVTLTINGNSEERAIDHLPCLIGRESSSCDFVILEPAVSRRHARALLYNDELYIEDVSEHNGTFLNGTKLPPLSRAPLNIGDEVSLGRATIKVEKLLY